MRRMRNRTSTERGARDVADGLHSAAIHLLRRARKQETATGEGPARLSALSVLVLGGQTTLGRLAVPGQGKAPALSRMRAGGQHQRIVSPARQPHARRTAAQ